MTQQADLAQAQSVLGSIAGISASIRDGGAVIDIATPAVHASIALQGAQVLNWRPSGQSHDVLWLSSLARLGGGKAIRGGIPLCWPWFGMHADPAKPQHGFARNSQWHLTSATRAGDDVTLVFALPRDCAGLEHLEGQADLQLRVTIGAALDITLETTNIGGQPFTTTQALHTYFRVGDVSRIEIVGLDGATYRDNTDGGREKRQSGVLTLPRETVALFDQAPETHVLTDPLLARRITITRTSGASTVVWNPGTAAATMGDIPPGQQANFVCIESGAIGRSQLVVLPGKTVRIGARYEVAGL